jgi:hypothetical protein
MAAAAAASLAGGVLASPASAGAQARTSARATTCGTGAGFIATFCTVTKVASTVPNLGSGKPGNGDVNPYGVVVVKKSVGKLVAGDVLVSNFNAISNFQGTGTTIMQISPAGTASVFANVGTQVTGHVGLTTALAEFANGFVVVGSLPTTNGMSATATAGALYVLNSSGKVVETIKGGLINGPWDMTAYDGGKFGVLFVTNVLNGTVAGGGMTVNKGTVVRVVLDFSVAPPKVDDEFAIGTGFAEQTNSAALVLGPTGVGLSANDTLYVSDTVNSAVRAIPDALFRRGPDGTGTMVTQGNFLNAPLGLTMAPNGDILTVNGGDGQIVETTPAGSQINWFFLDTTSGGGGSLFGLAVQPGNHGVYFVDDNENQLNLAHA